MTANEWKAAGLDWQWFCESCARQGWVEAARANIRAAKAHGVTVDVEKVMKEYDRYESFRT